jgi:hypothetical protein
MLGWHSIHKNGFEMDHHLQLNLLTLLRKDADDISKVLSPEISKDALKWTSYVLTKISLDIW